MNFKRIIMYILLPLFLLGVLLLEERYQIRTEAASEKGVLENIYISQSRDFQKIRLFEHVESNTYHVYIPASENNSFKIFFDCSRKMLLDGVILSDGDNLPELKQGKSYILQMIDEDDEIIAETEVRFYFLNDVATVFIDTETGAMDKIEADKEYKESAQYAVYTQEGILDIEGECSIKGRGNYSWRQAQKPYNIILENEETILGMGRQKKWALLSNWGNDIRQLRNKVALDVGRLAGTPYSTQCEFVNLYLNGQYNGLYLLSQRVNIEEEVVLEFDERYKDESAYFTTKHQNVVIKEPENVSAEQYTYISDFLQQTDTAIYSETGVNDNTQKAYSEYIDMDSWAIMYGLQEYFVQWDVEFSSFYMYMNEENPILYAGPIWDFDYSCGELYYGSYPKMTCNLLWVKDFKGRWLKNLSRHEEFQEYCENAYLDVLSPVVSKYLEEEYWTLVDSIDNAVYTDSVRWSKGNISVEENAEKLYDWLVARQKFLNNYYANEEGYYRVAFEFSWGTVYYYVEKNTALGFLPTYEYGEAVGYSDIIGWQDEYGKEVEADDIITGDVVYKPIWSSDLK